MGLPPNLWVHLPIGPEKKEVHPASSSGKDKVAKPTIRPEEGPDATADYPQSGATAQVFCLRQGPLG
jgi:hypothetical protein